MRVISQNGHFDVSYELTAFGLSISKDNITKVIAYVHGHAFDMARYSNENFAKEAMTKLARAGTSNSSKFTFPMEGEIKQNESMDSFITCCLI